MPLILIKVNKKPIYRIQRPEFSNQNANAIVEQLRFASYDEKNTSFECKNKQTADLIFSLFSSRTY